MSKIKKHQCPSCGGNLIVDNDNQMYRCASCGSAYDYEYFREEKLYEMSETYLSRGEVMAAVDTYRLTLKNHPHDFTALRGLMLAAAYLKDMDDLISISEAKRFSFDSQLVSEAVENASEEDKEYFKEFGKIFADKKDLVDLTRKIEELKRDKKRIETTVRLTDDSRYDYYYEGKNGSQLPPELMFIMIWICKEQQN